MNQSYSRLIEHWLSKAAGGIVAYAAFLGTLQMALPGLSRNELLALYAAITGGLTLLLLIALPLSRKRRSIHTAPETPAQGTPEQRTWLHRTLSQRFSKGELRTLCFDLGVDYDDLPNEGKTNKARELIAHLERHNRILALIKAAGALRPDIDWNCMPKPDDKPPPAEKMPTLRVGGERTRVLFVWIASGLTATVLFLLLMTPSPLMRGYELARILVSPPSIAASVEREDGTSRLVNRGQPITVKSGERVILTVELPGFSENARREYTFHATDKFGELRGLSPYAFEYTAPQQGQVDFIVIYATNQRFRQQLRQPFNVVIQN